MLSNEEQMNSASHMKGWIQSSHLQCYSQNKYIQKKFFGRLRICIEKCLLVFSNKSMMALFSSLNFLVFFKFYI